MARPTPAIPTRDQDSPRGRRRAQQRAANPGRAAEMHAARLAWEALHNTDELLNFDPAGTQAVIAPAAPPGLNVGCSGWFYWDWKDRFYPPGSSTRDWFRHYASQFNTVELNAPFYSWPTVATVRTWTRQARDLPFVYTVKVNELITHTRRFARTRALVRDFGFIHDLLGPRMGCFLFQLPPGFHYDAARLHRILDQLDPTRRNVIEFRHRSWWNPTVTSAFRKAGAIFCSCSAPGLPDELVDTGGEAYLRFHGTRNWYRHDYTPEELAVWVDRLRAARPSRIWAYFNNDYDAHAIRNTAEFRRQLVAAGLNLAAPPSRPP